MDPYGEYRGIPVRDWRDARINIDRRLELEEENRELRKQIESVQADVLTKESALAEQARVGQRAKNVDTLLEGANPEGIEELRWMVEGFAKAESLDLEATDNAEALKKAAAKLRARKPGLFQAAEGAPAVGKPTAPKPTIPSGTPPEDITPANRHKMTNDEWLAWRQGIGNGGNRGTLIGGVLRRDR